MARPKLNITNRVVGTVTILAPVPPGDGSKLTDLYGTLCSRCGLSRPVARRTLLYGNYTCPCEKARKARPRGRWYLAVDYAKAVRENNTDRIRALEARARDAAYELALARPTTGDEDFTSLAQWLYDELLTLPETRRYRRRQEATPDEIPDSWPPTPYSPSH